MTEPTDAAPDRPRRLGETAAGEGAQPGRRYGTVAATAALLLAADQLSKWWAVNNLSKGRDIELVGSLRLRLAFNPGAAFSLGSGRGLGPFIAVLALVVVVVLLFSGHSTKGRTGAIAVGLIAGGALGNLADRALRRGGSGILGGYVVDFVDLQWWPAFNVADAAICVGAVGLVLFGLRSEPAVPDP